MNKIKTVLRDPEAMTEDMREALVQVADIYHCNFSLFQSLPDVWAIDQMHPIAPIQRLHEPPCAPLSSAILPAIQMARLINLCWVMGYPIRCLCMI